MKIKMCTKCKKIRLISKFSKNKNTNDKLSCWCKKCINTSKKIWYNKNINKIHKKFRKNNLYYKFGISLNVYKKILKSQNNVCAICKQKETRKNQFSKCFLGIDHNHNTNKNRGILCFRCNFLIGQAKENIKILKNAIKYLRKWKE